MRPAASAASGRRISKTRAIMVIDDFLPCLFSFRCTGDFSGGALAGASGKSDIKSGNGAAAHLSGQTRSPAAIFAQVVKQGEEFIPAADMRRGYGRHVGVEGEA